MSKHPTVLVHLRPAERSDFLPPELEAELRGLAERVEIWTAAEPTAAELAERLEALRPEVVLAGWGTPLLPLPAPEYLRYVCYMGGSVKNVVTRAHLEAGLPVTNWGDSVSRTVAEHALFLVLAALRQAAHWSEVLHHEKGWGAEAMRPLKQFGSPIRDSIGPMPYSDVNSMIDRSFPKGALNYWKSNFLIELSDAAISTIIECFAECPTTMSQILLEHVHGAATRVPSNETAFEHRREGYNFLTLAQWTDPEWTDRCIAWARTTYQRMQPFFAPGRYVNYLGDDEIGGSVAAAYGSNYPRLQQIKAKYDPDNIFRMNQNIQPRART